jgi:hypothetical protein
VKADMDEVGAGMCSLSEKIRRRNLVPELVFTELKADLERLEQDGTLARLAVLRGQGSAQAIPGAETAEAPEPKAGKPGRRK